MFREENMSVRSFGHEWLEFYAQNEVKRRDQKTVRINKPIGTQKNITLVILELQKLLQVLIC